MPSSRRVLTCEAIFCIAGSLRRTSSRAAASSSSASIWSTAAVTLSWSTPRDRDRLCWLGRLVTFDLPDGLHGDPGAVTATGEHAQQPASPDLRSHLLHRGQFAADELAGCRKLVVGVDLVDSGRHAVVVDTPRSGPTLLARPPRHFRSPGWPAWRPRRRNRDGRACPAAGES